MKHFIYILACLFFCSCNQTSKQNSATQNQDTAKKQIAITDTYPKMHVYTKEEIEINRKEFEEFERLDSIRYSKILSRALKYANANKNKNAFKFDIDLHDTSVNMTAQLAFGYLFSASNKHLLVKRLSPSGVVCTIFLLQKNKFKLVAQRTQDGQTFMDDTLKDVNGDGYKDYLIHWYPSSGCCTRDVYNVFLYLPATGTFTSDYEFINPTFFAKEKIIRGVNYGYFSGLYKYKWNGLKVDTLEFVYHDTAVATKYYITKQSDYNIPPKVKYKVLNALPKEYEKIASPD